jgi:hypothetical protein
MITTSEGSQRKGQNGVPLRGEGGTQAVVTAL